MRRLLLAAVVVATVSGCGGEEPTAASTSAGASSGEVSAPEPEQPAEEPSPGADPGDADGQPLDVLTISELELEQQGESGPSFLKGLVTNVGSGPFAQQATLVAYQDGQEVWRGLPTTGGPILDASGSERLGFLPEWPQDELGLDPSVYEFRFVAGYQLDG